MKHYTLLKQQCQSPNNPCFIYFLGLLWADGYIDHTRNVVTLALQKTDFEHIIPILKRIDSDITYKFYNRRQNTRNSQPQGKLNICSKEISNFFIQHDYPNKSTFSPDKILSKIPENLLPYWWRGYFDGDGYVGKKKITITSNINQDWSFLSTLKGKNIQFRIYKNTNKSVYSCAVISNLDNLTNFFNYIYKNYDKNNIGLMRKYLAFQQYFEYKNKLHDQHSTGIKYVCKYKQGKYKYYTVCMKNKTVTINKNFTNLKDAIKFKNNTLSKIIL